MSTPTPRSARPRRRIAGERRVAVRPETVAPEPPAQPAPGPAPEPAQEPPTARDRGVGPSWATVAGLAAFTLLLVAAAALLGLRTWDIRTVREEARADDARRSAPAAAERAAASVLAYDYRTLGADQDSAERFLTPAYAKKYGRTFDRLVEPNAAKLRARVSADVKASGVSHADPDRVTVLLYVNQTTTSTANGGEPQLALNRVQLSMVRSGRGWLVDNITSY